jgi:voltage-gated potassium channel
MRALGLSPTDSWGPAKRFSMQKTPRKRSCEILAPARNGDRLSRWADVFIIGLISANVIAIILESVSTIHMQYARHFAWFEAVSVAIFTVE